MDTAVWFSKSAIVTLAPKTCSARSAGIDPIQRLSETPGLM